MIISAMKVRARSVYMLISRYLSPSQVAAIGVLLITAVALFVPPYIGMADNGDFFRIIYSNGLYFNAPNYDNQYFGYFVKEFGIFQYFNENESMIASSQSLFIRMAILLNSLFVHSYVFDIRFQSAIYTVLFVLAIYLVVEGITWNLPKKYGYIIALLAVFIFGDTGYTAYFNSFFSESVVYIMMLFVFASWLLLYRKRYNDYAMLILFIVSSIVLTTSKQQNAPVGMILGSMGVTLLFIRKGILFRTITAVLLCGVFLAGVATYVLIPKEFVNINQFHAMTRGVLLESSNPESTLSSFGINEQYAILKDTIYYEQYATVDVNSPLLEKNFYSKYGFVSIAGYYVTHIDKLNAMLNIAAKDAFSIRPAAMGNYEQSVGKPFRTQTNFFTSYSLLKKSLSPKTYGFIVIWGLLVIFLYSPSFWRAMKARQARNMLKMFLLLSMMLIGLAGILVSIIGAGDADLAKHEFLFTVAFDLVTFLLISDVISRNLQLGKRK